MTLYVIKKLFTFWFLPPGIFILVLFVVWFLQLLKKKKKNRIIHLNLLLAFIIYFFSTEPVANFLLSGLEERSRADISKGDVIILLGGGHVADVPDFKGKGIPAEDMMTRAVGAFRLHKKSGMPVIVSAGRGFDCREAEALVIKEFLIDMGIDENKIIVEDKSKDTRENALLTKQICDKKGFKNPVLITSAYHMKRSLLSFKKAGFNVIPFSVDYKVDKICYDWTTFMPVMSNLHKSYKALKEYFGLVFYYVW